MKKPSKTSIIPARSVLVPKALLAELRDIIQTARTSVAQAVNAGLTMLHWEVGNRVRREILKEKRAEYGAEIVQTLSAQLVGEFGQGFSRRNLFNMLQFAEEFPDEGIVSALRRELRNGLAAGSNEKSKSHLASILPSA